ncbi:MAG: hypothetical protein J6P41_05240 [Prevotella sp.]|nr:hypothetical protein [Prevotella sp.]
MKNFNMTRFGHVLKLDFAEGRKAMMWGALCMLLLYLLFFWFAHNIGYRSYDVVDWDKHIKQICYGVSTFSMIAMYIYFLVTASTIYRGEQKKQQRIAWLMLPATNLEKFLSRWIYMLVFMLVGGVLPIGLADCIHMVWLQIADHPVYSMTKEFVDHLPKVNEYSPLLAVVNNYLSFVFIHALFLLGGVFFKKYHFIATSVVFAILSAVVVWTINSLGYRDTPTPQSELTMSYIFWMCFHTCLIAAFTWLAYRLFCRYQVVTHKFANI